MFVYNQNNYSKLTYPSSAHKSATIATSGCGVVSTAIAVNNLAGKELFNISQMRDFAVNCKARVAEGTDFKVLLNALCKKYKEFSYTTTNNEDKLVEHLKKGGMAIANQGDSYNVFSSSGHFVVAYKMVGENVEILDPQMYNGKYDAYSRPKRIVKKTANGCVVSPKELGKATADRSPAYFLISYSGRKESEKVNNNYPYFTPNAKVKANSDVYADNARKVKIGSVSKGERVKTLFVGDKNACIQYKLDSKTYKVGLIYSTNVQKDK